MGRTIVVWLQRRYEGLINSIAFLPAGIVLGFLALAVGMIMFDFSDAGKHIKSQWILLRLQDASTARTICSAIAAGIISLSVFSFSMVMVVLNQAASQMSNRVLDKLIGNRFQQIVLGIYIGTIVYALFLLSTIRDTDSGVHIAALSTYLLIIISTLDIFLFIYFLHYITESIKVQTVVQRIYRQTSASLKDSCYLPDKANSDARVEPVDTLRAWIHGVYEGFNREGLLKWCKEYDCTVRILVTPGSFLLKGTPVLEINRSLRDEEKEHFRMELHINEMQSIDRNCYYGFRQLMEVAIKALSPGINDPGSAVVCLRALFRLLSYRACYHPEEYVEDENHGLRVIAPQIAFEDVVNSTLMPIWDYGVNDRVVRAEFESLLKQLIALTPNDAASAFLEQIRAKGREK